MIGGRIQKFCKRTYYQVAIQKSQMILSGFILKHHEDFRIEFLMAPSSISSWRILSYRDLTSGDKPKARSRLWRIRQTIKNTRYVTHFCLGTALNRAGCRSRHNKKWCFRSCPKNCSCAQEELINQKNSPPMLM